MSRPVKEMIVEHYKQQFANVENALVVDIRGIEANDNNEMRLSLAEKDISITVVKNSLARKAFDGTSLAVLCDALSGPAAIAFGAESVVDVAREIVSWAKKVKDLDLKGACLDGEYFDGDAGVKALARFPTREEAIAKVVQVVLSPAGKLVSCATSPGANIVSIVKTIEEKLEKGEEITKVR